MNLAPDILSQIPPELLAEAAEAIRCSPILQQRLAISADSGWSTFVPRPDRPEQFDQQAGFIHSSDRVAFLVGGNASGTTEAAAVKTAKFVLERQAPPRKDTPFWIISNTYDQTCDVCWLEKLLGHGHIPECEIDKPRIHWLSAKEGKPLTVPLKPWPTSRGGDPNKNWKLEFKSFEQGRTAMQAKSIGGFWFSEQFPLSLFLETLRGCREYMFNGGQFAEFTPIDPELCLWVEKVMDDPPDGWQFYRANTELNKPNLAEGWYDSFFGSVPDEMVETRKTGALASFEGVIYSSFNTAVHVARGDVQIPHGAFHYRGIDWGASAEHPMCCVWCCRDAIGDWLVYDEYWCPAQDKITQDHVIAIVEKSRAWGWPGRWKEANGHGPVWIPGDNVMYGSSFADPSRPGELNEFNQRGIVTMPAANDVYMGIDCIRSKLKCNPITGEPHLKIHERCIHLIEEMRKYRWMRGKKVTDGGVLNPKAGRPIPLKRADDLADSLRYCIFSTERGRGAGPGSMSHRDYANKRRSVQVEGDVRGGLDLGGKKASSTGWFSKR